MAEQKYIIMCWVYVLSDENNSKYYIGSTNNLSRRIKQHLAGHTRSTRVLKTYNLVYKETFDNIDDARLREKKLKSYKSHKYISWLIKNNNSMGL